LISDLVVHALFYFLVNNDAKVKVFYYLKNAQIMRFNTQCLSF